jgi:hypothetical protein
VTTSVAALITASGNWRSIANYRIALATHSVGSSVVARIADAIAVGLTTNVFDANAGGTVGRPVAWVSGKELAAAVAANDTRIIWAARESISTKMIVITARRAVAAKMRGCEVKARPTKQRKRYD